MPRNRSQIGLLRCLIALLAALAVFAVLVSPAPDELPGTTPHLTLFALTLASAFISLADLPSRFSDRLKRIHALARPTGTIYSRYSARVSARFPLGRVENRPMPLNSDGRFRFFPFEPAVFSP